jgi:CRP-like cAMP-binding protein
VINRLLGQLGRADREVLVPLLRVEQVSAGTNLTSRFRPISHAWFPRVGLVSISCTLRDGRTTEAASVGDEGAVGLEAVLDSPIALSDAVVQIGGDMACIRIDQLRAAVAQRSSIRDVIMSYVHALSAQLVQSVACSTLHTIEQRCCRWLLTAQDRCGRSALPITQDALAGLLGVGRPRVNAALRGLVRNGRLCSKRGEILIRDRAGMQACSCECYGAIRRIFSSVGLASVQS